MKYRFRKPELAATVTVILVAAFLFGLGIWQLHRLQWKNELLAGIEAAQSQAPVSLISLPRDALAQAQWRNVTVAGHLLNDKEMYATPRYLNDQMGYAVLTPLMIATNDGPEYVLVNRGWVPPEKKDPRARTSGDPSADVIVQGVVRAPLKQGAFQPDNNPARNLWFWYDLDAMGKHAGVTLLPVYIDASKITFPGGNEIKDGPAPFPIEIKIRNDHLGYAITWFMLGIAAVVMFGCYYWERDIK